MGIMCSEHSKVTAIKFRINCSCDGKFVYLKLFSFYFYILKLEKLEALLTNVNVGKEKY